MSDIFLSYNEKDRDTVRRLAETFRSVGWSVWWDRRIPAGGTWRTLLERELQSMRCMVVVWSSHSIASDWVHEEATEGRQAGRLVPVSIEAVRPPPGFREIQCADLVGWDGTTTWPGMRTLIEDLEAMIGKPVAAAPAIVVAPAPTPASPAPTAPPDAPRNPLPAAAPPSTSKGTARDPDRRTGRRAVLAAAACAACAVLAMAGYDGYTHSEAGRSRDADVAGQQADHSTADADPHIARTGDAGRGTSNDRVDAGRSDADKGTRATRCANLIQRGGLGDPLSSADDAYMKKECGR